VQQSLFDSGPSQSVSIAVRSGKDMTSEEKEKLTQARLDDLAHVEIWTPIGTNRQMSYATHGLFRFFGKFPPPVATYLIKKYADQGGVVSDPMCGSGTTGVECLLQKRSCLLMDVNPLCLQLAKVKTRYLPHEQLCEAIAEVKRLYEPAGDDNGALGPIGLRDPKHWFLEKTAASLRGLRAAIDQAIANGPLRDFLLVAFASIVRRVSRATTQQGRLFLDAETALEDVLDVFLKRATQGARAIAKLPVTNELGVEIEVLGHDLRSPCPHKWRGKCSLVIVHPPYFNAYRYSRINSLELAWLGIRHADVRKHEIREFFKVGKPQKVVEYVADMALAMANAAELLKKGGSLALMIGDTVLKERYIPVIRQLLEALKDTKLRLSTVALRVPQFTEASWVASQRRKSDKVGVRLYDFILLFEKVA